MSTVGMPFPISGIDLEISNIQKNILSNSPQTYRIRPTYHTVRLGFSKLLETPCSKLST